MTPEQQLVADFLAKGGKPTRVEAGEATMSHNEWKHAVRGTTPARVREDEDERLFNQRNCVTDHAGREFWTNGYGERL